MTDLGLRLRFFPRTPVRRAVVCLMAVTVVLSAAPASPAQEAVPFGQTLKDLPLIEVPALGPERDILAVLITGDGGWAIGDRGLAEELATNGIPVVGLNSLKYFWTRRTPETASVDLARILRHFLSAWGKKRIVLIGYSRGADVLPFMLNRLPDDLRQSVKTAVFIGPSAVAEFEIRIREWLGGGPGPGALPVVPEIGKIDQAIAILCVYGENDPTAVCGKLEPGRAASIAIKSGHVMGGNYGPVAAAILKALGPV